MSATEIQPVSRLTELVEGVRGAVDARADWSETAQLVAEQLRRHLPTADVLTPEQRRGSPDGYRSHTLHVEPDGSFSIIGLVWRPGQVTRIHDHMTWCVFGVIQGVEHTPRQVVMNARHLAGPPDEGDDRERSIGLDVQRVAAIAVG